MVLDMLWIQSFPDHLCFFILIQGGVDFMSHLVKQDFISSESSLPVKQLQIILCPKNIISAVNSNMVLELFYQVIYSGFLST